jgi:hypothetical protein
MRLLPVKPETIFPFILVLFTIYSLWGVQFIPFHPDEATQLFMSSDVDLWFTNPGSMAWDPGQDGDLRQQYRQLDAPFTRYWIGLGRSIAGLPGLPADWDWAKSWEANQASGALPSEALLRAARFAIALLLPLSMTLVFMIGKKLQSGWCGLAASVLFATNALVLLHQRRAMAEGPLVLGILFIVWVIIAARDRPVLMGLAMALAFSAKQSSAALAPVAILALVLARYGLPGGMKTIVKNLALFCLVFTLAVIILNPILWSDPVQAALDSVAARQELLERQVAAIGDQDPNQVLTTPGERLSVILLQAYLVPPAFADIGNYLAYTMPAEMAYLSIPGHNLFRGPGWAGVFLSLTIFAWVWVFLNRREIGHQRLRNYGLVALVSISLVVGMAAAVPLPFQRYSMPLVPFIVLWSAVGIEGIVRSLITQVRSRNMPVRNSTIPNDIQSRDS